MGFGLFQNFEYSINLAIAHFCLKSVSYPIEFLNTVRIRANAYYVKATTKFTVFWSVLENGEQT